MISSIAAGGVVVNKWGEICMVSRKEGYWMLPKGHVEEGETVEQAAIREVMEETGLRKIRLVKKLGIVKRPAGDNPDDMKTIHYFLFKTEGSESLKPTMEINYASWMGLDDVLKKTSLFKAEKEFLEKHRKEILGDN